MFFLKDGDAGRR